MCTERREKFIFNTILTSVVLATLFLCFYQGSAVAADLPAKIVIVRDNVDYPPMEFHQEGKLTGLHVELVNEVASLLGISVEWQQVPWRRALNMVKEGQVDGITYIGKTPEREEWAIFLEDNIISDATFSFMINKDDEGKILFSGDVEEFLKDRPLLLVAGFNLPEDVAKANPKTYEAPRIDNLVEMLRAKRYDVAIVNKNDFLNIYRGTDVEDSVVFLNPPVSSFENYVAFSKSKGLEGLAQSFAQEMAKLKSSPKYIELKDKFSN